MVTVQLSAFCYRPQAMLIKILNLRNILRKRFFPKFIDRRFSSLSILVKLIQKFDCRPYFCSEQIPAGLRNLGQGINRNGRCPFISSSVKILYFTQDFVNLLLRQRQKLRRFYQKIQHSPHWFLFLRIDCLKIFIFMLCFDHIFYIGCT